MHILLQQPIPGSPSPRFLRLMLEQDLLGGWELTRETGHLGGKSQIKRETFLDRTHAMAAFEITRSEHEKRGFLPPLQK